MNLEYNNLIIAGIFLLLGVLVIIKNMKSKKYYDFLWFCDLAPFLLVIAFIMGDEQFIKGIINIGLIVQFNTFVLLFKKYMTTRNISSVILHLAPINLALFLTYKIPPLQESLIYSFMILVFIFCFTFIFTKKENNINLMYHLQIDLEKKSIKFKLPLQTYLWVLYTEIIVVIPTFLIQYLLYNYIIL